MSMQKLQQGAALLIALLITALASVLLIQINERVTLDVARTATIQTALRSDEYARGLETLAGRVLRDAGAAEPNLDHKGSIWAQPLPGLPIPGGIVTGHLQSLDGRFNINSMLTVEGQPDEQAELQFRRLLGALGLQENLSDAVLDWIDADSVPRASGAENDTYASLPEPYRSLNRPLLHISELRQVAGIDSEVYSRLLPHISALPLTRREININLASIPVLMSLHELIDNAVATQLFQQGRAQYRDTDSFFSLLNISSAERSLLAQRLTTRSEYFLARADVVLNGNPRRYYSLLRRTGQGVDAIYRQLGVP